MTRHLRTAAVGAALALSLTACGGGDSAPEDEMGPLDRIFEDIWGGSNEETGNAQQMRVEEIVAECMAELGFEYTPVDYSQTSMTVTTDDLEFEWGTREFAEKYGYGATTDPWGNEDMVNEPPDQQLVDPNQDYVMAMSETEQTAYYAALYGNQEYPEGDEEEWVYDWTQNGCQGKAQHEVYESVPGMEDEAYQALMEEMNGMWEGIMSDPRLTELNGNWASCMADAGYPGFTIVDDAPNSIYDQLNAIWENAYVDISPDAAESEWQAVQDGIDARIAEITPVEIETAVADFDCRDEIKYDAVYRAVNADHQQRFYDAHKDELEAWRDAALAARG
jgi:hypothetical protein